MNKKITWPVIKKYLIQIFWMGFWYVPGYFLAKKYVTHDIYYNYFDMWNSPYWPWSSLAAALVVIFMPARLSAHYQELFFSKQIFERYPYHWLKKTTIFLEIAPFIVAFFLMFVIFFTSLVLAYFTALNSLN